MEGFKGLERWIAVYGFLMGAFLPMMMLAVTILVIILIIIYVIREEDSELSRSLRIYYRLIPLDEGLSMDKLVLELGKRGVYAKKASHGEVVIDEFIEWRLRLEEIDGKTHLSIEAGVKTWFLVVTLIALIPYAILGVILAAIAFWRFAERRDILRSILTALTGNPAIASQL
ncbi:MAG: hypothetical protein F7C38_00130 [Desulfurococcales archaeon]|nr:hypothetical protein [Desulfurococcales archaeon]